MTEQEKILNKDAKIVIQTQFVLTGRVLEVTPTHHVILTSDNKYREVKNENVVSVDVKQTRIESDV